jgi:quinol monooxygenase YgiN
MIKRIVKMSFKTENIEVFKAIFKTNKQHILNFDGCIHVELLKDENNANIFFTLSFWENEDALNAYRSSELFNRVWSSTKALFNDKPEAWSLAAVE